MKQRSALYWFVSRAAYPGVLTLAFVLYWYLNARVSLPITTSAIVAIGICAIIITILESVMPYRKSWAPAGKEVVTDSVYLGIVQMLVPKAVTLFLSVWVLTYTNAHGWNLGTLWPHQLPVWVQVMLMFVIGDFFRYWIHRAVHMHPTLWRLHAVHHSSEKLYWINVARFHPVEKFVQQLFDVGPFILMGVSPEVLIVHFIFYAVDGFFQHCNIDLKLGFLNYVVSGPQLHHWHHSKIVREGNSNFGNHIIIYDLLFGTWFLPKDREVGDLGLNEKDYPQDVIRQQVAPFLHRGF